MLPQNLQVLLLRLITKQVERNVKTRLAKVRKAA